MSERPAFTHAQVLRVIGGIAPCILLSALDQTIVAPAIPAMSASFASVDGLSWIISAYLLTSTAATPIIGRLSDIRGRRALLMPCIVLFAVASVLCALSRTLPQMVVFRALQGIGGAGLIGMAHATIADVVSPRERGRYQIFLSGMWGVASIAGPIVGGAMTDRLSWRAIFWINVPLCAAAFVVCRRALRILPRRPAGQAKVDATGAALLTAAVVAALLVITRAGQGGALLSPISGGLVALCALALWLLVTRERRAAFPMLPPRLFAESVVVRCLLLAFANALVTFATLLLLPLHFQLAQGASASASGLLLTPFLLSFVVLSYGGGQLSRRFGRTRGLMSVALACCTLGTALLASIDAGTPPWLTMMFSLFTGAGIGLVQPNITVTIQNAADPRDVGIATGCMLLLRSIGGAFGATLAGAILAWALAAQSGLPSGIGPSLLEGKGATLATLDAGMRASVLAGIDLGFHVAFAAAAVIAAASLAIALTTRDLALRSA